MGEIGNKYNNHPLVLGFLNAVMKFQEDNYQAVGGTANGKRR